MMEMSPVEKNSEGGDQTKAGNLQDVKDLLKNYEMTRKAIVAAKLAKTKPMKDINRETRGWSNCAPHRGGCSVAFGCFNELAPAGGGLR